MTCAGILLLAVLVAGGAGCASNRATAIVGELLERHPKVARDPSAFRLQVLIGEVRRGADGRPKLVRSGYRADAEYFYPASAIKTCAAAAALASLEELRREARELTLDTPLVIHGLSAGEPVLDHDASNLAGGTVTLRHEIRKLFLVSDNEAFNRLYDFVGPEALNRRMWAAGLESVRISHRLSVRRTAEEQRQAPRIELRAPSGTVEIPPRESALRLDNDGVVGLDAGTAYMEGEERVARPMSFRYRNRISLEDLQDLNVAILRPDIRPAPATLDLSDESRELLREAMREFPAESVNPRYDAREYPDQYVKFLLPGLLRACPKSELRYYNKVGQAYGFTIENAYVENTRLGRAFFLTAVIYTNLDGVLNDDAYEYESVALPLLADLGELVARQLWSIPAERATRK